MVEALLQKSKCSLAINFLSAAEELDLRSGANPSTNVSVSHDGVFVCHPLVRSDTAWWPRSVINGHGAIRATIVA